MEAKQIRQAFFDFFRSKGHSIVPSAPIVVKNDPTLMFTNAGMNQFKDYFLGNMTPSSNRIADTQKCLRVSGKHNDLEEVGVDSYHHTMFEMLGNWSFGDYFKDDAIAWAWELLTSVYGLDEDRLYVTVFGGDQDENLNLDLEAIDLWKRFVDPSKILQFGKKDNFWEMGDTGPCGPSSEIHIDMRSEKDRASVSGASLVNQDHPEVVEIWNLVFIQYNRKADGSLETLPEKHVDTGLGFERLCMTLQGKTSSYDSDLLAPYIAFLEEYTGIKYTNRYDQNARSDIAMRVITDHIRAVCFAIADGATPESSGAGYVVRRILRRAVRYYYSFLQVSEPLLYKMAPLVADSYADVFPEIKKQEKFLEKMIFEEERSFLRTLASGLRRLEAVKIIDKCIDGDTAFELYDTFGFPIDLTRLIAKERGLQVDEDGFEKALAQQRSRSKKDAEKTVGDWINVHGGGTTFVGYDQAQVEEVYITKYREVVTKNGVERQAVLSTTPFYAEGGGQIGDTGVLIQEDAQIKVLNTVRENDLIIHLLDKWPEDYTAPLVAKINNRKRLLTENNHSATHLLHAALRMTLGNHVTQKGSLVTDKYFRFDFSHHSKLTGEELEEVEKIVNEKIRKNIARREDRDISIEKAQESGAMMLFGEKYGNKVRMITFDPEYSVELCGGCHVEATGQIGYFKIVSESAIAAGVRRIEAITSVEAEKYINEQLQELTAIKKYFKNPKNIVGQVGTMISENKSLQKDLEKLKSSQVGDLKGDLLKKITNIEGINFLAEVIESGDTKALKNLIFQIEREVDNAFILFGTSTGGKPQLMLAVSKNLTESKDLHAGNIVRDLAKFIDGGGGGQPFFATAGGKNPNGLDLAISEAKKYIFMAQE